jgi:hypothetical protein
MAVQNQKINLKKLNPKRRMNMQTFKQQYLFLSAQAYRIEVEDETTKQKTGEIIDGITIRYLPVNELTPITDPREAETGVLTRGIKPAKLSMPTSKIDQLKEFPAMYECEMEFAVVADKQQVRIKNVQHISNVTLQKQQPAKG